MPRHLIRAGALAAVFAHSPVLAQGSADAWCRSDPPAPFCTAARGARAEGWSAQSRSEVMARHGMVDILDLGANTQAAVDMGRFRHSQLPNTVSLETPLYDLMGARLAAMGHTVRSINGASVGGAQIILRVPDGAGGSIYRSGSDFRKDGQAAGW